MLLTQPSRAGPGSLRAGEAGTLGDYTPQVEQPTGGYTMPQQPPTAAASASG